MYLTLLCILVFASSGYGEEDVQEVLDKVKAGIEAGNAIIGSFIDENFSTIGTISTKIGPFLGAIGPAVTMISILLPSSQSAELKYIKDNFTEMNLKFDRVFTQFDEVKHLIQETSLKGQYGTYEHTILALSYRLQQLLSAPNDAVHEYKALFISIYDSTYGNAALTLFRGMMEERVLTDNIPETAITYTHNHRLRVQNMIKGVANLILQGVKVRLSYLKVKGENATYELEKNDWEVKIKELITHMQSVDRKVTNA